MHGVAAFEYEFRGAPAYFFEKTIRFTCIFQNYIRPLHGFSKVRNMMLLRSFLMFVKWTRVQENVYVRVAVFDNSACMPARTKTIWKIITMLTIFLKK